MKNSKIAKLFAYLFLAIFLPIWLFMFSNNDLTKNEDAAKRDSINFERKSKFDSLLFLAAVQNLKENSNSTSTNSQTDSNISRLVAIQIANASKENSYFEYLIAADKKSLPITAKVNLSDFPKEIKVQLGSDSLSQSRTDANKIVKNKSDTLISKKGTDTLTLTNDSNLIDVNEMDSSKLFYYNISDSNLIIVNTSLNFSLQLYANLFDVNTADTSFIIINPRRKKSLNLSKFKKTKTLFVVFFKRNIFSIPNRKNISSLKITLISKYSQ